MWKVTQYPTTLWRQPVAKSLPLSYCRKLTKGDKELRVIAMFRAAIGHSYKATMREPETGVYFILEWL
jgi:hypothetical protein